MVRIAFKAIWHRLPSWDTRFGCVNVVTLAIVIDLFLKHGQAVFELLLLVGLFCKWYVVEEGSQFSEIFFLLFLVFLEGRKKIEERERGTKEGKWERQGEDKRLRKRV